MGAAPPEADGMVALNQHVPYSPVLAVWMDDSESSGKLSLTQYLKWLNKLDIKPLSKS